MAKKKNWRMLFEVVSLFNRFSKNELDSKTKKTLEEWNPEDVPSSFNSSQKKIDEGVKRVKENLFQELGLHNTDEVISTKRLLPFHPYKYIAVAASLLLLMGVSYFWFNSDIQPNNNLTSTTDIAISTIQTAEREIKNITLPDGTLLHINAQSRISYDKNRFNNKKREIWLEGEAFFDVAKNPDKPFIIHHRDLQTVVRGTSFNIRAYDELDEICISVKTGHVEVRDGKTQLADLRVNEQAIYHTADKSIDKTTIDWNDAGAWMEQRLVLRNATMKELQLRIKQLYGKELIFSRGMLSDVRFEASYRKESSFKDIMEGICLLYNVTYKEIDSDKIMIYR
ncbi:ferric-dicitrate binding protein FerR (iron transport regulator) [Dysgonomonas hofstadii]|uniref:Ferric-dicitrate binding protein FerR (Iron transport regulator) n=1 Tax=Dysgonomonas hofstadii TaxID=637886 RepID=A0A840CHN2_9BACT|nr:FecR family protein [Dysgonomonas hofstadii]MBB4034796.1 ferric-dicitrate binding protein FerR (iron transport regulator) [Dysgonomonas hofstadii]